MEKLSYSDFKNDLEKTCRSCLNKRYGLHLVSDICYYAMYPGECLYCGEVKNIVIGISRRASLKIRLKFLT